MAGIIVILDIKRPGIGTECQNSAVHHSYKEAMSGTKVKVDPVSEAGYAAGKSEDYDK